MKQLVLRYLRKYHDIATHTIYNDIFGYIQNQEKHQTAYTEFYIGVTSHEKGKYKEAIKHYDEVIRSNPQIFQAYYNRGHAKDELGQYHDALADYDQAIRINPQDAKAYANRGNAKDKLGKHKEAIADYNEAIRLNPQYAVAYYNRGTTNKEIGEHENARTDFQRVFELATGQGNQALAQAAQRLLDKLPPASKD